MRTLWDLIIGTMLSWEYDTLPDYPLHIRMAFSAVGVWEDPYNYQQPPTVTVISERGRDEEEIKQEKIMHFAQRWGGLDQAALVRALYETQGIDRLRAIFALGYSPFQRKLDLIAPILESPNRLERCAAACVMGFHRDERAIPALRDYFAQDDVDASGKLITEAEYWYQAYYPILALILANWGSVEMTGVLHQALVRMNTVEEERKNSLERRQYVDYDTATVPNLFYALGRRGDFSILQEVKLSEREHCSAVFKLALGFLNFYERIGTYDGVTSLITINKAWYAELLAVWKEQLGLREQEIEHCFSQKEGHHPVFFLESQ